MRTERANGSLLKKTGIVHLLWGTGLTVLLSGASLSMAQDTEPERRSSSALEEIIVTATKRAQSVQDVGIAVTALSGEQMEALGFTNAQQIASFAPGVSSLQPNGEANYSIGIRGVINSDFTTNVESPIAVYLDEVYISQSSGTGFALFDMERVEILRGPQGTLYGRNATGGLAHFIARKPTQEFSGYGKFTLGDYKQIKFEGAVGGPIVGALSGRASASFHKNDGYVENRLTGDDLNNADDWSVRLQLLFAPGDNFELLLNARLAAQDIDTGFFENVSAVDSGQFTPTELNLGLPYTDSAGVDQLGYRDNDGDPYAGDYDDPGFNDLENRGYSATVKWAISDSLSLTAITDYSTTERTYIEDSDASPSPLFNFFLTTDATQKSQEVRVAYDSDRFKWVVGAYYLGLEAEDSNGAITEPFITGGGTTRPGSEGGLNNPYTSELESLSLFGQVEYAFSDQLTLIAGLRSIRDKKDFVFKVEAVEFLDPASNPGFSAPSNLVSQGVLGEYSGKRSDNEIAGRLQLDWKYNDTGLLYLAYNRGVKGGGYNAPIFPLTAPLMYDDATLSYDPEQLDSFEVGFKTDLGTIGRLNAAAYYYDYKNYQLFVITGVDTLTVNSSSADAKGFEVELQLTPGYRWDILFGIAYNDTNAEIPALLNPATGELATNEMGAVARPAQDVTPVQSPKWNLNGLLRYAIPFGNGEIAFQVDADYRDKVFFALTGAPTVEQDAFTVANASVNLSLGEHWRFSAAVQNITDEEYQVQAFDLSGPDVFGLIEQYYGRPRWWSVSARYEW